jgi:hypothetical protein
MAEVVHYDLPEYLAARRLAKRRERFTMLVAVSLAIGSFVAAGLLLRPMNEIRLERQLVINPETIEGLPPDIALLGKLGTFRALAIDWASIRGERLKEEGKHYEALTLHQTVCKLQPRFVTIWVYAAWNMAYNISVTQYSPEARWQWVQNGIKLLRDDALRYNPRAVTLYKELAWIYWHKVADYLDDEHMNYKRALAVDMEDLLGATDNFLTDEAYIDWFAAIVKAPRPEDVQAYIDEDPELRDYADRLQGLGLAADRTLLTFVARNIRSDLQVSDLVLSPEEDELRDRRIAFLKEKKTAETRERLLNLLRSRALQDEYKFDLDWMLKLMEEDFGPIDWRSAHAHALYWATYGDHVCKVRVANDETAEMNTARFVLFALQSLIVRGHIVLHPNFDEPFKSYLDLVPDTRFIPFLNDAYHRLAEEQWADDPDWNPELGIKGTSYWTGYVNSVEGWIELLFYEGGEKNRELAEQYLLYLREKNPHPDGAVQERYTQTVEEFVMGNIRDHMDTYRQSAGIINQFLEQYLKRLSLGQEEQAEARLRTARLCHDFWMRDKRQDYNDRRKIQPLRVMLRDRIEVFMRSPQYQAFWKAMLWKHLDLTSRQLTYDRLRVYFVELCAAQDPPWSVREAFPEPEGMEAARQRELETVAPDRQEDRDQGSRYKDQ